MTKEWTVESLRQLAFAYMPAGVLLAAAEMDVFRVLAGEPLILWTMGCHTSVRCGWSVK